MQNELVTYFNGEKDGSLLLIGIGVLGLAAATLFMQERWGLRSFAVTLAVFALFEIGTGIGIYVRTGPQVGNLLAQLGSDAALFFSEEGTRMAKVQKTFFLVEYVEVVVIAIMAITAVAQKNRFWLAGIALGVLLNVTLLLAFDLAAERRSATYLGAIEVQANRK